jgi:hypothetical protein
VYAASHGALSICDKLLTGITCKQWNLAHGQALLFSCKSAVSGLFRQIFFLISLPETHPSWETERGPLLLREVPTYLLLHRPISKPDTVFGHAVSTWTRSINMDMQHWHGVLHRQRHAALKN